MNEYISKHEPIEEIQRIYCTGCNSYNGVMCRSCEHQDDINIIEDTKAADVQPVKHGQWIPSHPVDVAKEFKCTACQEIVCQPVFDKTCYYNFCPNCGARMDGEQV